MPRTTDALVRGIVGADPDISLDPFISIANKVTTNLDEDTGSDHDSDTLTEIETWLAAHFYASLDPSVVPTMEKADAVSASYQSAVALNLNSTRYGQAALILDDSGVLAAMNQAAANGGRSQVQIFWGGTEPD